MPRNIKSMNALDVQKQLLIAESDLNRIQLADETAALHSGVHAITHGVKTAGGIAASAAMLANTLAVIPHSHHAADTKTVRLQLVLYGAVLISSVCLALIPRKT